ncbi:hypothetical protein HYU92_05610 [Candidatus Curtissbacteria bacterium]|nr:hypothetical protein [Candidatus Curtissbacteria bacterium]
MSKSERTDFFVGENGAISFTDPIRLNRLCKILGVGDSVMIREVIRHYNLSMSSLKDETGRILPPYANIIRSYVDSARQEGRIPPRRGKRQQFRVLA